MNFESVSLARGYDSLIDMASDQDLLEIDFWKCRIPEFPDIAKHANRVPLPFVT